MPQSVKPSIYRTSQTLQRGLELIQCFNGMENTASTVSDLSKQTGLHRTTVKRLLETLRVGGFVKYDPITSLYSLTFHVNSLSCGYRETVRVVEIAGPVIKEISKQIAWPCSILIFDHDEMVVRSSTRAYSHLSFHSVLPGRRLPLLKTAAGKAFFAFSSPQEQIAILEILKEKNDRYSLLATDTEYVRQVIEETQGTGYGINSGDWEEEPKFGAISFPIIMDGQVIACLNCIYLLNAVMKLNNLNHIATALINGKTKIEQLIRH
ncbi:helix-turn-helix domain-containing protein [Pseudomonas putida]|uniref:helix-turn-helix domain-containing protein n=1 Tax=Pseudomonas putida TaxID=303 RepID=UPI00226D5156|nr:helix-turn-helix domain-containing protein [Pseudomonas putida]WAB99750.1 helix-turn-helix domain-containing protein [Pseudomonas putida]